MACRLTQAWLLALLLAKTQRLDDSAIALNVTILEVVEQSATFSYQFGDGTSGDKILVVLLDMLSEVSDAIGEKRNLAFGRARVGCRLAELGEELSLLLFV